MISVNSLKIKDKTILSLGKNKINNNNTPHISYQYDYKNTITK